MTNKFISLFATTNCISLVCPSLEESYFLPEEDSNSKMKRCLESLTLVIREIFFYRRMYASFAASTLHITFFTTPKNYECKLILLKGCFNNVAFYTKLNHCIKAMLLTIFFPLSLQGLIPGPPSYFTAFPNVYVAACGTQFYKQCFPRGSIHLALSCLGVHILSKAPCSITGGLLHFQSQNPDERELFTKQAAADWETFLLMRAKELSSGRLHARRNTLGILLWGVPLGLRNP